ncbi:ferritin [Kineococcus sp. R8]|uniref:ferritin n=1 Tax=Kineococcus siccus TaxID=2696567 RepID=UPI001412D76F|nr:ferritin [Kineococcus siccus]NAZ81935.1 ferritin [Kineococcus siccus]
MRKPGARSFVELLTDQVASEFHAHQQYVALAVWFDAHDLKQLAKLFYAQAIEERNHGMMMVQYQLDRDIPTVVPAVPAVRNEFTSVREIIELALAQEQQVTRQIEALFAAARAEGDFIGEQFVLWFLKEQVEEIASMTTLLAIVDRAGDDLFRVEDWLAREGHDEGHDSSAPPAAGGAV